MVSVEIFFGKCPVIMDIGSFGEELRMERVNRGIALERITEITKINQRHLVALEENEFRVLPGGILNKGIVRGYVRVLGLDEMDWIGRFQQAYVASGELLDDDRNWIEFAANVGRARIRPRDAATERLKWAGAMLLVMAVGVAMFFVVRYFGFRSGWWPSVIPGREATEGMVRSLGLGVMFASPRYSFARMTRHNPLFGTKG